MLFSVSTSFASSSLQAGSWKYLTCVAIALALPPRLPLPFLTLVSLNAPCMIEIVGGDKVIDISPRLICGIPSGIRLPLVLPPFSRRTLISSSTSDLLFFPKIDQFF